MKNGFIREIGISAPASTVQLSDLIYDFNPSMPTGLGATPVNNLVRELVKSGYNVSIFSLSKDVKPGTIEIIKGNNLTIYYGHYRESARSKKLDFFYRERKEMARCIKMANPDVIHAHWQYEFAWPAVDSGINCVLTCHDAPFQVLKLQRGMYRFVRLLMAIRNLRKFKNITAVSPYAVEENEKFTNTKIDLIANFEPEWIFDLYKERNFDGKVKIAMINVGFHGRKNVAVGMLAFNQILDRYPNAELHLYGDDHGIDEHAYRFAQKNEILKNIHFHGAFPFKPLMQELSECHLFLHTALEESCPMVIIEAMAMGIPVIGGDKSGGVPWMLENGGGLLADIKSPADVSKTILKMLDKEVYETMAKQARNVALNRFHPNIIVKQYLESYKKAIQ